eukprot:1616252-Pyramimonas_sp.AAC.1
MGFSSNGGPAVDCVIVRARQRLVEQRAHSQDAVSVLGSGPEVQRRRGRRLHLRKAVGQLYSDIIMHQIRMERRGQLAHRQK